MKKLTSFKDQNAQVSVLLSSDHVDAHVLAAGVAESFIKPAGARFVRLSGTGAFFYNPNGAAAVPGADVADGSASVVVPFPAQPMIAIEDIVAIDVISSAITTITAEWWA